MMKVFERVIEQKIREMVDLGTSKLVSCLVKAKRVLYLHHVNCRRDTLKRIRKFDCGPGKDI